MTQSIRELQGDEILARDGEIGSVDDVYFDDERWAVRYLVVDTGDWLPGKRVLIAPASVEPEISALGKVRVRLTREQVQGAPDADADQPVSRQYEIAHANYFGYPYYWSASQQVQEEGDTRLRSGAEVIGYGIEARDGPIGEVQDFLIDEETWAIRDVVVDTLKWWPGGHVRVHPEHVESIDWGERKMRLRLTRDEVKRAGAPA